MNIVVSLNKMAGKKIEGNIFALQNEMLPVSSYAPSVDEIVLFGLDETGVVKRFQDRMRAIEKQYGRGCVAARMSMNHFGDTFGYGWQRELQVDVIDEAVAYNARMMNKIITLIRSKIAGASAVDKLHYESLLLAFKNVNK